MSEQVTHEAEQHRQHVRFRIPATVQIGDHTFHTADWSVSGLSIDDFPSELGEQHHLTAHLIFDFADYDFRIKVNIERVRHNPESSNYAGRFSELSSQSISLIHYMINAYLAGEIVTAGDLLAIASENKQVNKDLDKRLVVERSGFAEFAFQLKRILGHILYLGVIIGLLWFVSFTFYNRMYVVESNQVTISSNSVQLRSPGDGVFEMKLASTNKMVAKGELIGTVKRVNGGVLAVESPCNCMIDAVLSQSGVFVALGEPLVTVRAEQAQLSISALVDIAKVDKITEGDKANMRLSSGEVIAAQVTRIQVHPEIPDTALVSLEPMQPLSSAASSSFATVRIETF